MEGLRLKAFKDGLDITISDIKPGFVDTAMAQGDHLFWVASPQKAENQIVNAIKKKKPYAYITKRWHLVALALRVLPNNLYKRL